jgi:hypothetical protein
MTPTRYCYGCNRTTVGEPLYCNFCGRSYDVKVCPRHHINPRYAGACSQCGSRDLSTPQPKVPWWVPTVGLVIRVIPGSALAFVSGRVVAIVIPKFAFGQEMFVALILVLFPLGILWTMWSEIPRWYRTAIYRMLQRRAGYDGRLD